MVVKAKIAEKRQAAEAKKPKLDDIFFESYQPQTEAGIAARNAVVHGNNGINLGKQQQGHSGNSFESKLKSSSFGSKSGSFGNKTGSFGNKSFGLGGKSKGAFGKSGSSISRDRQRREAEARRQAEQKMMMSSEKLAILANTATLTQSCLLVFSPLVLRLSLLL